MDNTKLVVGGNVSGNIGSCEVNSTDVSKDFFHVETMAVNSCTGQIVADYIHIDGSIITIIIAVIAVGILAIGAFCIFLFELNQ